MGSQCGDGTDTWGKRVSYDARVAQIEAWSVAHSAQEEPAEEALAEEALAELV